MNKLKTNHLNATGPARGNELAHGHHRPARPKREGGGVGLARGSAHGHLAWPAWLRQGHAGACAGAAARLGHEAGGHSRPRQGEIAGACDAREAGECGRVARRGWRRGGRGLPWRSSTAAPWSTVAGLETALPELSSRRKHEHDLKESEAELRARDYWPRRISPAGAVARREAELGALGSGGEERQRGRE